MDGNGGRRRVSRETSPDRVRGVGFSNGAGQRQGRLMMRRNSQLPLMGARRAQIVYYLCRNGQLEHPHFMELSQLPNQQLRLRDVMERLTVLRGKGMPSLYSWSCKRSYKNGYVWNDLSENDVIYPADGAEYVLKGSEIVPGCSEQFQQLRLRNNRPAKTLPTRIQIEPEPEPEDYSEETEGEGEAEAEAEYRKSRNLTEKNDTHSRPRCSRGVSTEQLTQRKPGGPHQQIEIALDDGSPPSSSSSDRAVEPGGLTKNSVFFNLIACGSGVGVKGRKSGGNLHKGVVSRVARASRVEDVEEVRFMSENPRFGNLQGEDKEYFSGSVVLEASRGAAGEPRLKKSSSYSEERSSKLGIGEECLTVAEDGGGGGVKGKCIPGRRKSSKPQNQQRQSNK